MQRSWMEQGVRNAHRKAKDNDKLGRKFRTETTEKQAAKARQTERLIERLEVVEEPRKEWQLQMQIAVAPAGRLGGRHRPWCRRPARGVHPRPGRPADRLGRPGRHHRAQRRRQDHPARRPARPPRRPTRAAPPSAREWWSARSTRRDRPSPDAATLLRTFGELLPDWPDAEVRTLLAKYGLGASHVRRSASGLSPGERTRAGLALLQARGVNLLVLDEPTNHLDLPAIEQLEQALDTFPGTVVLVSHDRRLLDSVRLTRRLDVHDGQVTEGRRHG